MVTQDHPYKQEYLEAPLRLHKFKLECLQKRIALMPEGKTEYEKNENTLLKLVTGGEVKALSNVIAEREGYYLQYWTQQFLPDIEDLENNMATVCAEAEKRNDPAIKDQLEKVKFIPNGSINIEGKIVEFKLLRNLLK
jgi:hypothetical protein